MLPTDGAPPAPDPRLVETWLTELGVGPAERNERDGIASWDLVLDGRRRFDAEGLCAFARFCDPRGQFLAQGSRDKDELITADLDLDKIREVRNVWQFYRDRRPETQSRCHRHAEQQWTDRQPGAQGLRRILRGAGPQHVE